MKKKLLFFVAALAAVATFTSCSSDEDLVQAPEPQPEQPAVVKGIPFSVTAFNNSDETRAIRYGSTGTGIDYNDNKAIKLVNEFKLFAISPEKGKWIEDVVFARSSATTDWAPARNNDESNFTGTLVWGDTENESKFYAITDNAFITNGVVPYNQMIGVREYFSADDPYVEYEIQNKEVGATEIGTDVLGHISDQEYGWLNADRDPIESFYGVDSTLINDLMVAYKEKAPTSTDGSIALDFNHALSGLSIVAKFNDQKWEGSSSIIYGIRIHGLATSGKYTFSNATWTPNAVNTAVSYYKTFGTTGVTITAENKTTGITYTPIVAPGEWLVIPQTVSKASVSDAGTFPNASEGAYIEVLYYDVDDEYLYVGYMPFSLSFEAGKNYTLVLNLTKVYNVTTGVLQYTPTQTGGGSRRF
jgi:hypothetical protein